MTSTRSSPTPTTGTTPSRPQFRPRKDQPFYNLYAENDESFYTAYVSQQNLEPDQEAGPVDHPEVRKMFEDFAEGGYRLKPFIRN